MGVTGIDHGETPVPSRDRRIGIKHCDVGFNSNDYDGKFSDAVSVLVARSCGFDAISVCGRCLKEGFRLRKRSVF